jgi:hypothetical protein
MDEMKPENRVRVGCRVVIKLLARTGEGEQLAFDIVDDEQADYRAGFLGVSTALAQAILGEKPGIMIPYFTDDLMGVEILSIRESSRVPSDDAAARRGTAVKNAKDQIEFTNAVLFAASVDTKWGSYDADGLDYETWKRSQSETNGAAEEDG